MELKPNDYIGKPKNSRQGQPFAPWDRRGYTVIEVLPKLKGKPWDEVALGYVHALRPSQLRVVQDGIQLDAETWRVTVWLKKDGLTISRIEQEVEVGLPDKCPHGAGLDAALHYGLNSPQVEWHNKPGMECYDCTGDEPAHYKLTDDGKRLPFPHNGGHEPRLSPENNSR
jgi:hypothetical protein